MKKILLMLLSFFSTAYNYLFASKGKLEQKKEMITVHNMKVRAETREAKILASFHTVEPPRSNGVQLFNIGTQSVWALNMKNAIRKAKLYPNQGVIGG